MRQLLLAIILATTAGCASTKMTSYSDPSFKGAKYSNFVVHTPNADLESQSLISSGVCEALVSAGARCTSALEIFPPTRHYSNDDKAEVLRSLGVDGYLLIALGGGSFSSQHLGSQSFGTTSVYGNSAATNISSVSAYSYSRREGYDLVLVDTETLLKAWIGGARTTGQGLINVTDEAFAESLGSELADSLRAAGHL